MKPYHLETNEPITLTEFDNSWPRRFRAERDQLRTAPDTVAGGIKHWGNIAVASMARMAGRPNVALLLGATVWLTVGFLSSQCAQAEVPRGGADSVITCAGVEEGQAVLTHRDDFIAALSGFDRAARLKTDRPVAEGEFLEFLGRSVRSWSIAESNKLTRVSGKVLAQLAGWNVPLPPTMLLVKTSGEEEGQAAYTRQHAIILPQHLVRDPEPALEQTLLHELFHVLSRHQPELRTNLYRVIGFKPVAPIDYPTELRERKITNPDGFHTGWLISVTNQNQELAAIPILYASQDHYDPNKGGEFFDYLVFKLLVVTNQSERWLPSLVGGRPQLLDPRPTPGYLNQVGRNTGYIIHPDEILAENFVKLINGVTNVPSPAVIAGMRSVLRRK